MAMFYGNIYSSVWCLALVALDRYVALVHPCGAKTLRSRQMTLYMTGAVRLVMLAAMLPLLLSQQTYPLHDLSTSPPAMMHYQRANKPTSSCRTSVHCSSFASCCQSSLHVVLPLHRTTHPAGYRQALGSCYQGDGRLQCVSAAQQSPLAPDLQ
ncbi:hypothetical protein AMECASPLE_038913 [Ameca splendens]|uniref:G-protein coupled receptors family 1 profile domain-containing protein n=1 Tax=Ameca splendens TaxID=208324 RepID=A0ABV1AEQ9_9TELE